MRHLGTERFALFQSAPFSSRQSFISHCAKSARQSQRHGGVGEADDPNALPTSSHHLSACLLLCLIGTSTGGWDCLYTRQLCLHSQTYLHYIKGLIGCGCCQTLSAPVCSPPLVPIKAYFWDGSYFLGNTVHAT